ncbi:MAG: diguanylate cyclase, partial [Spirulina sp. SIO3F2]|nr:diguanylate cyclase [Spirulina sp. SIO3F2]
HHYPFPHRKDTGGPQDAFQHEAIEHLRTHPEQPFFRRDQLGEYSAFRYAEAIIMGPSCVSCHNSHPDSPRKDWRVGDVRGVLEISQPIDSLMGLALKGMRMTLVRLVVILGLGLVGLTFVMGRLRHTTRELQHKVSEQTAELRRLASLDGLTQISNRRSFDQHLQQEWQRGCRSHLPLSLVLCDVDCFKQYNDTYGHQAGDVCLQAVARVIGQHSRRVGDLAARYGGEEFALLLPNTDNVGALQVAEQIRVAVQNLEICHRTSAAGECVSLSLGVATLIPEPMEAASGLIAAADAALYQAKEQGRNRSIGNAGQPATPVNTPVTKS